MKSLSLISMILCALLVACQSSSKQTAVKADSVPSQPIESKNTKSASLEAKPGPPIDSLQIPDEKLAIGRVHTSGGVFHDGEVLENIESLNWIGLFKNDHGYYLKNTTIRASRAKDEILDEDNAKTGWMVSPDNKDLCELLINGVEELKESRIDTFVLKKNVLFPGEKFQFKTSSRTYSLSATGRVTAKTVDWQEVENYKLYLECTVDGKPIKQLIAAIPHFEDAIVTILWCGDLDLDEKPDFIINTSYHYNMLSSSLYLSSKAFPGQLVRYIGTHSVTGC